MCAASCRAMGLAASLGTGVSLEMALWSAHRCLGFMGRQDREES